MGQNGATLGEQLGVVYRTSDFWLAAYLKAKGYKIVTCEDTGRRGRHDFVFQEQDPEATERLVRDYFNRDGSIEPRSYAEAVTDLRAILRQTMNDQEDEHGRRRDVPHR